METMLVNEKERIAGALAADALALWMHPWKINMEPTNHPFSMENDLPNLHDYVPC